MKCKCGKYEVSTRGSVLRDERHTLRECFVNGAETRAAEIAERRRRQATAEAHALALEAEVERLMADLDVAESRKSEAFQRLRAERDEARASLARVTKEAGAHAYNLSETVKRARRAEAECARLREEGAAAEARGFAAGVEAAARKADDEARGVVADLGNSVNARLISGCAQVIAREIRALRPSTAPSPRGIRGDEEADRLVDPLFASSKPTDPCAPWLREALDDARETNAKIDAILPPRSPASDAAALDESDLTQPTDLEGLAKVLQSVPRIESLDHLLDAPAPATTPGTCDCPCHDRSGAEQMHCPRCWPGTERICTGRSPSTERKDKP